MGFHVWRVLCIGAKWQKISSMKKKMMFTGEKLLLLYNILPSLCLTIFCKPVNSLKKKIRRSPPLSHENPSPSLVQCVSLYNICGLYFFSFALYIPRTHHLSFAPRKFHTVCWPVFCFFFFFVPWEKERIFLCVSYIMWNEYEL